MALILAGLAFAGATWERAHAHQGALLLPAAPTRAALRELVRDLAEAAVSGALPPDAGRRADALHLEIEREGEVVYLADQPGFDRGATLLALRLGPLERELVLQAPHPLSDEHTGALVGGLFDLGQVRAASIATNHRAGPDADPSALDRSWLSVVGKGLADALPDAVFVQLHGFDPATSDADAVLSPGRGRPDLEDWAAALRTVAQGLGALDLRTGEEVPALAALDNAQGRWMARHRRAWWHLELGAELRGELRKTRGARLRLRDALLALEPW